MKYFYNLLWAIVHPIRAIKEYSAEKEWVTIIMLLLLYIALCVVATILFLSLFAFLSGAVSDVYGRNKMAIDNGIFVLLCFAALVYYLRQHHKPEQLKVPPDDTAERQAAERTYVNIASVIVPIFQKLAQVFPLVSPVSASDIYSPARARKQGEIWYYHYAMVKSGNADIGAVKRILNDELTRVLFDHEAHGIARNTVFIDGVEYPALLITDVKDTGTYLEVNVVVMSEKVNRHLNFRRASTLDGRGNGVDTADDEFLK